MPTYFQRPENALKRANEFIDVGKKQRALDALYDVIKSKKHRTWQKIHEPIMEKYLVLCVELKKSHIAKEGLYQYKNICQQVNIKSLEDVVRNYLNLAEEKTEAARAESHQAVVDIDDLDVIQAPESLLLSAVSSEDTQDRSDRAILTPWVKFLWESYRQCLDLLRNNSSVEKLYQDIAQQAFRFCLKYARKTEFRKLCDNLRTHLGHIHKHQHQQRAINLNNPESQAMHLETRLVQLDSAIQMELWQEAFKAVEDIHELVALSKKPPKPSLIANYYQKLGLVFWKAGNHLFHACAYHRLYHLSRDQRKNLTQEELYRMSSRVLCATLAIPIQPSRNSVDQLMDMDETSLEKQRRLANLLGLNSPPTRTSLVKDLVKLNVMQSVPPELQNLYQYLEVEFHPLKLASRVQGPLEYIEGNSVLAQYIPALQNITIMRLLKQVSQVYQTIEFSRLLALAPFTNQFHLEGIVVQAAKNLDLQVRICHRTKSLSFGTDLVVAQKEDVPEGPVIQTMPSEQLRNQLIHMAQALEKAILKVQPRELTAQEIELRNQIVQNYRQVARKEHHRILQRRQIIEERKEELENMNTQREREEVQLREDERKKQYDAEMARLEREANERERQRRLMEQETIKRAHTRERIEQLRNTAFGARVLADLEEEELAGLDADDIMQKQVEQLEKEKKELQDKLKGQEKKIDYFARAKRLVEIPLLKKQYDEESVVMRELWYSQEGERVEALKAERENALLQRDRLCRIKDDKDAFIEKLKEARMSVYKEKLRDFKKKTSEVRQRRLEERKEQRKEERRSKWIKEREEEEQRKMDEEMKRQREEAERLEIAEQEAEVVRYQEKVKKLEEQAERQRQREREIEEREEKRREEERKAIAREGDWNKRAPERAGPWRPKAAVEGGGGGWRERERAREESWKRRDESPPRGRDSFGPPSRSERISSPGRESLGPPVRSDRVPSPSYRRDEDPADDRGRRDDRSSSDQGVWRRPPVEEKGGAWRAPSRNLDRGPSRDLDRGPSRDLDRGPPRDFDRGPSRDLDRGPSRDLDRGPSRDFDRGPSKDFDRGPSREFDRGPSRDFDRGPSRDFDRGPSRDFDRGPRDFDRGPRDFDRGPRDLDRGSRDLDRGPPQDAWRRGGDTWRGREDRGPPPRDFGDRASRDSPAPPRDDWRSRESSRRGDPPSGGAWQRSGAGSEDRPSRADNNRDIRLDEGWSTVRR